MDQAVGRMIIELQKRALEDERYQCLLDEYESASGRLIEALAQMTPGQQNAVTEYFGVFGAMHLRMLELALRSQA